MGWHDPVQRALKLASAGRKDQARNILKDVLARDKNNVRAWAAMAYAAYSRPEAVAYLQQILKLNPGDEWATKILALLDDQPVHVPDPDSFIPTPSPIAGDPQPSSLPPPPRPTSDGPLPTPYRRHRRRRRILIALGILALLIIVGGVVLMLLMSAT